MKLTRYLKIFLLAIGTIPGCSLGEGMTDLMLAAKKGETQQVARLLDDNVNVDKKSRYGWTALMFAAYEGHIAIVKLLLVHDADINHISKEIPPNFGATGGYGSTTALREAIRQSHLDVAHLLLDSGAEASYEILDDAGASSDVAIVKKILVQGLSLNDIPEKVGMGSPLDSSAMTGNEEMIRYLLSQGADVNLRTWADTTPLTSAIKSCNPKAVKLLLEGGADPNLPKSRTNIAPRVAGSHSSDTHVGTAPPLYEATRSVGPSIKTQTQLNNTYRILELLFEYGADDKHWQSKKYDDYISSAEWSIAHNLEWSQKTELPKERIEGYEAKVAYWRKVLALLKKEQASLSREKPVAA